MDGGRRTADSTGRAAADPVAALFAAFPVSAAPFVVTLYGDVVAPRGGELWTGNIVDTLGSAGIAESRVRTALSRLVAGGRLEGSRAGRRSYYRLTPAAGREFSLAARLIYAPADPPPHRGWHLVLPPEQGRDRALARLTRLRFGVFRGVALLPDRGTPMPPVPGLRFSALTEDDLPEALAAVWPLSALSERMRGFIHRFERLDPSALGPDDCFAARLILVHAFREIALRDPLLPAQLLPRDWPGAAARAHFVRLYVALTPGADTIAAELESRRGPLRPDTARLERRRSDMHGSSATGG